MLDSELLNPKVVDDPVWVRGWNWLLQRDSFHFGLVTTYTLLFITVLVGLSPIEFSEGVRSTEPVSLLSWMPESWLRSGGLFFLVRCALIVSAILWGLRKWVPFSCWATVILAVVYWSLRNENLTNGAHIFHVTNMLLVIHAAWFHFYHREIDDACLSSTADDRCYPRWVFWLSIFFLGWFHSLAGFSKVMASGWTWGDGTSLQLWVDLFGWKYSPSTQLMLWDTRLTAVMQTGALIIECASILVIFNRWIRYALGIGLFGFYLGVLTTFVDFGFHFNAVLVALFLLPTDRWFELFTGFEVDEDE